MPRRWRGPRFGWKSTRTWSAAGPGGVFEFTTVIYVPTPGATGWVTHANIQNDALWYATGDAGTQIRVRRRLPTVPWPT